MQEYQNKRKDRSDAVSRKIEKLKMRLNRRLVKLAKAMDAPAERAAADGYERENAAAVARAAARQQSRKAAAGASGAMPMRSGMTPYGKTAVDGVILLLHFAKRCLW